MINSKLLHCFQGPVWPIPSDFYKVFIAQLTYPNFMDQPYYVFTFHATWQFFPSIFCLDSISLESLFWSSLLP